MDITIHFPENVGKAVKELPNANTFLVEATKQALKNKSLADDIALSIQEADQKEYATQEVRSFFAKWNKNES